MPNKYKRKAVAVRGNWSEESLKAAINAVKKDGLSVRAAGLPYQIPRKALERRLKKGPMGTPTLFGEENEKKSVAHIKTIQAKGYPFTADDVRKIAHEFTEQLKLTHRLRLSDSSDDMPLTILSDKNKKLRRKGQLSWV